MEGRGEGEEEKEEEDLLFAVENVICRNVDEGETLLPRD